MTPERNPDIRLDSEQIPPGLQLIEGKNMMQIARGKRIPFSFGSAIGANTSHWPRGRRQTILST